MNSGNILPIPFQLPSRYVPTDTEFQGGQGLVVVCDDIWLDRRVAVKFISRDDRLGSFERELKAFQSVNSLNVVDVYDLILDDWGLALVEEFLTGEELSAPIERNEATALDILDVYQVAAGLTDIHAAGVVHRDLKPTNVRRAGSRYLKILDFGISTILSESDQTRAIKGTFPYMAPEMLASGVKRVGPESDVYSFGLLSLLMLNPSLGLQVLSQRSTLNCRPFSDGLADKASAASLRLLDETLNADPQTRPPAAILKESLRDDVLKGKHQALLRAGEKNSTNISAASPLRVIDLGSLGCLNVFYDGLKFRVSEVTGAVHANRRLLKMGDILDGSCVIAFGLEGKARSFVTFDVTHPEILP